MSPDNEIISGAPCGELCLCRLWCTQQGQLAWPKFGPKMSPQSGGLTFGTAPCHATPPPQAGAEQSTRIASLEQERDRLSQAAEQHRDEMAALRAELQQLRDTLSHEQESSSTELEMLQTQLRDKVP